MTSIRKLREPKTPRLFRIVSPKAAQDAESRRFAGLRNRQGVDPPGDIVTLNSKVVYYTNRENRDTHWVTVFDLEAKSAANDLPLKIFGTILFAGTFLFSILCVGWDEIRAVVFPLATEYRPGNIASTAVTIILLYFALFTLMYNNFIRMDHTWNKSLDSFFANGARPQMEGVRDCMREFKRFVKWRRYMRLTMWAAGIIIAAEIILLLFSDQIDDLVGLSLTWSNAEIWFALSLLVIQGIWFAVYWWMRIYFTIFRDPTLQLCVMVNVMDRASVATTNVTDRERR